MTRRAVTAGALRAAGAIVKWLDEELSADEAHVATIDDFLRRLDAPLGAADVERERQELAAVVDRETGLLELVEAARLAQCACSIRERDSGHLVECWMPALSAAIAKAEGQ